MADDRELKVSFMSKKDYECPVCGFTFKKEELFTGGGRMIAGKLTEELHRQFEPSAKYGKVYPLIYLALVCPSCWFASMESDFNALPDGGKKKARDDKNKRFSDTALVFSGIDFKKARDIISGAASQYLALRCYDFFSKETSPTVKQGLSSLRCAWILDDAAKNNPGQHYDWLATLFRKKAQFLYNEALAREQNGSETLSGIKIFGPDIDKNYSYEGMLYICAYLRYKYGPAHDSAERKTSLEDARRTISKLFGMGKSSKEKPGAFLEIARKLYDTINRELTENFN
ncbi:MAG: DUF2225 domain-containing protein [Treponema sp.]|jgi:uncharacterized protein (DUF2225 family)|nr:DUF2225 domain-containing protein [Treponema sp.]